MPPVSKKLLLPKKLAYTAIRVAVLGAVACGGESQGPADAAVDAPPEVSTDAPVDAPPEAATCSNPAYYCSSLPGADGGACGGFRCTAQECPPGCIGELT